MTGTGDRGAAPGPVAFVKLHGLGNDYVLVEAEEAGEHDPHTLARAMCHRRLGAGADGLLWVSRLPPGDEAQLELRIFNPDGSEAELCGNGLRCVVQQAEARGLLQASRITIRTRAGVHTACLETDGQVTVRLGAPRRPPEELPAPPETPGPVIAVDLGNPHAVCLVEPELLPGLAAEYLASLIATPFPRGVNVAFTAVTGRDHIHVRPVERGAGSTQACGSAAAAAAVVAHLRGLVDRRVTVTQPGGDLLLRLEDVARGRPVVYQTGPAVIVYRGAWLPVATHVLDGDSSA